MTEHKAREIIDMLNTLNEYLLALPDDILLTLDPRDNESLQQGIQFMQAFNDAAGEFSRVAARIEQQIEQFFGINPEDDELEQESANSSQDALIIRDRGQAEPHTLDESFTYKRPDGFVLGKGAYKGVKTWRNLYLRTLAELQSIDAELFSRLPQEEKFISKRGNPWFAVTEKEFRFAVKLPSGIYAEGNLSANNIRDNIKELLEHFGLDYQEMKIYLREE